MNNHLVVLLLINGMLCGLITLHLLSNPIKHEHTRILGACFGLSALLHGLGYLSLNTGISELSYVRASGAALIGPIYYYYFQSILFSKVPPILKLSVHLIPAIAIAFIFFAEVFFLMDWLPTILIGSYSGYLTLSLYHLIKKIKQLRQANEPQPMSYQLLKVLAALLATNAICEFLITWELSSGGQLTDSIFAHITGYLFSFFNLVTIYFALQRHPIWDWMLEHAPMDPATKDKTLASTPATQEILQQFTQQLNSQQWFKQESGFTIAMAARALNMPQRQLSEAINAETGLSYSQLMNNRRIEEATSMMRNFPDKSITTIMYDAGFRTKSSFNREFSRVTGKSPSEYQQSLLLA